MAPAMGAPVFLGGNSGSSDTPAYLQREPGAPHFHEETGPGLMPEVSGGAKPISVDLPGNEDEATAAAPTDLRINPPGDPFEQHADAVAGLAMRGETGSAGASPQGPPTGLQRTCASCGGVQGSDSGPCPDCEADLQRKESGTCAPAVSPQAAAAVARPGHSHALPNHMRARIEPALGQPLGDIRVHSDREANAAARSIDARAFTHGNHIWLGPGESVNDVSLMAHEATHTAQQRVMASPAIARQPTPSAQGADQNDPGQGQQPVEIPVEYELIEEGPNLGDNGFLSGYHATAPGLASNILAHGDHNWLSGPDMAQRIMRPSYWSPLLPRSDYVTLDRLLNELPRDLQPRIAGEYQRGGPFMWVQKRGFTQIELDSIPRLVARMQQGGISALSDAEADVLRRAAQLQINGASPGSPLQSYTYPDFTPDFISQGKQYRVRVRVPASATIDVATDSLNAFNMGETLLMNAEEMEVLVTMSDDIEVLSVQHLDGGAPEPNFMMRHSNKIRWGGRLLTVAGFAYSGYRISEATPEERPVVIGEEAGGQFGGIAGAALATAGCVAFGVTTAGAGLFLCGLAGGIAGGLGGNWLGGMMMRDALNSTGDQCPSCHSMQRVWAYERSQLDVMPELFDPYAEPPDARPLLSGDPAQALQQGAAPMTDEELRILRDWLDTTVADPAASDESPNPGGAP